jgi:hypothetical protein
MDTQTATSRAEVKAHAGETVGRARKRLAKDARSAAEQVGKGARRARKTATRTAGDVAATRKGRKGRRRWAWFVGAGLVAAGAGAAAYLMKARQRESEPAFTDEVPEQQQRGTPSANGASPQATQERAADSPAHRN